MDKAKINGLIDSGTRLRTAGVNLQRVRINGVSFAKLPAIEAWAVDLGYREAAWMDSAAKRAAKVTPK